MHQEQVYFKKAIDQVNSYLKVCGIYFKDEDETRNYWRRMYHRLFFCLNLFLMNTDAFGFFGVMGDLTVPEITYMIPCITMCFLADFKSYYFIRCHHHVIDLIRTLKELQAFKETNEEVVEEMNEKLITFLNRTNKIHLIMGVAAVGTFCVGPAVIIGYQYLTSKDITLVLLFSVWYPFDAYNYKIWPFVLAHQVWTATMALLLVFGSDSFYYTCCAFIHLQFRSLYEDMRHVAQRLREEGRQEFIGMVHRHRQLVRCIELLDLAYGKSTLFNALSSSLILCVTGFNILAIEDLMSMAPFAPFLFLGSVQIFLFCYYGDVLMEASAAISDAVYDTEWYDLSASDMKLCLIMLTRAQKPCKITAFGFSDINMKALSTIVSSAWSYFTLLKTMYGNKD